MWRNDIILTENLSRKWFEFEWGGVNKSQTSDEPFESQTKIPKCDVQNMQHLLPPKKTRLILLLNNLENMSRQWIDMEKYLK